MCSFFQARRRSAVDLPKMLLNTEDNETITPYAEYQSLSATLPSTMPLKDIDSSKYEKNPPFYIGQQSPHSASERDADSSHSSAEEDERNPVMAAEMAASQSTMQQKRTYSSEDCEADSQPSTSHIQNDTNMTPSGTNCNEREIQTQTQESDFDDDDDNDESDENMKPLRSTENPSDPRASDPPSSSTSSHNQFSCRTDTSTQITNKSMKEMDLSKASQQDYVLTINPIPLKKVCILRGAALLACLLWLCGTIACNVVFHVKFREQLSVLYYSSTNNSHSGSFGHGF